MNDSQAGARRRGWNRLGLLAAAGLLWWGAGGAVGGAVAGGGVASAAPAGVSAAIQPEQPGAADERGYIRVREVDDGVLVLELATRSFTPADAQAFGPGRTVRLVSAVHIADASFYRVMQEQLDQADLVLFEGVKPPGAGSIDPAGGDEAKAKATRNRLKFLKLVAEQAAADGGGGGGGEGNAGGALPRTAAELIERSGKRWRSLLEGSMSDGWGRPIRVALRGAEGVLVISSDGPDGRQAAADAGEAGDDLRVEVRPPTGAAKKEPGIQAQLAKALGLTFQLEAMDSSKRNWRSSDMSMDELQAAMEAAGADPSALLGVLDGSSIMGRVAGFMLGIVAQSPQMGAMVKMVLVETMGAAEGLMSGGAGGGGAAGIPRGMANVMRVIVEDRNGVVLKDVRSVLEREAGVKVVAVFYGAGHMSGLEKGLAELGLKPSGVEWAEAIRVDPRDAGYTPEQARRMREAMRRTLERARGR